MNRLLTIGIVTGSHGVHGELKVLSTSGEMEHFRTLQEIVLRSKDQQERTCKVTGVRGKPTAIILAVEGITDPETARTYRGSEIVVPREHAAPLSEGEYYTGDLVDCSLVYKGQVLGKITAVWNNGQNDMLDVRLSDDKQRTIPFQDEFIGEVDIKAGVIELRDDWILE
ncbi:MAG: ribosome maturation factor RimM [Spirochaeta sp.]